VARVTRWPGNRPRRGVVAGLLAASLAACGVPTGTDPTVVDRAEVPYRLLEARPGSAGSPGGRPAAGEVGGQIALVTPDDRIRLVGRSVPAGSAGAVAQGLLDALEQGPTPAERALGMRSALPAGVDLVISAMADGVASVDVTGLEPGQAADRLPLAVGQVVLTATSARGVGAVRLERDGHPVAATVAGGGLLTAEPLTRKDYGILLRVVPTPTP